MILFVQVFWEQYIVLNNLLNRLKVTRKSSYAQLRQLVQPYILRRLKTDKSIIADLPDKTEINVWCELTKEQLKLYTQAVHDMTRALENY